MVLENVLKRKQTQRSVGRKPRLNKIIYILMSFGKIEIFFESDPSTLLF